MSLVRATLMITMLALAACSTAPKTSQLGEYLDDATGTTVWHLPEPAVYARERPMLAANARDYVSLAPIELSSAGRREDLLWLWTWSTIDRRDARDEPDTSTVILVVDGEPMELRRVRPRTLGRWPYAAPVNGGQMALFPLSPSQALRLSTAARTRVVIPEGNSAGEYRLWHDASDGFRAFAGLIEARAPKVTDD